MCHKDTFTSSLRMYLHVTTRKYLSEGQGLLKGSPKTRVNYLCTPLDPKLLAALLVQAPLGPQSFPPGLCLGGMMGLDVERRQAKAVRRLRFLTVSVTQPTDMVPDRTATMEVTQAGETCLVS